LSSMSLAKSLAMQALVFNELSELLLINYLRVINTSSKSTSIYTTKYVLSLKKMQFFKHQSQATVQFF
jgi:hypothetical protein